MLQPELDLMQNRLNSFRFEAISTYQQYATSQQLHSPTAIYFTQFLNTLHENFIYILHSVDIIREVTLVAASQNYIYTVTGKNGPPKHVKITL